MIGRKIGLNTLILFFFFISFNSLFTQNNDTVLSSGEDCDGTNTWLGVNSNWGDVINWSLGVLPCENSDVIIVADVDEYPVVGQFNGVLRSLTIQEGASMKLKSGGPENYFGIKNKIEINGTLNHTGVNPIHIIESGAYISINGDWNYSKIHVDVDVHLVFSEQVSLYSVIIDPNATIEIVDQDIHVKKIVLNGELIGEGGSLIVEGGEDEVEFSNGDLSEYNGLIHFESGMNFELGNQLVPDASYKHLLLVQSDTNDCVIGQGEAISFESFEIIQNEGEVIQNSKLIGLDLVLGELNPVNITFNAPIFFEEEGSLIVNGTNENVFNVNYPAEGEAWVTNFPVDGWLKGTTIFNESQYLGRVRFDKLINKGSIQLFEEIYVGDWEIENENISSDANGAVVLLGNITVLNSGDFHLKSELVLEGVNRQVLNNVSKLNSLVINKPSGDLFLESDLEVENKLLFQKGIIEGNNHELFVSSYESNAVISLGKHGYVNGRLRRNITTSLAYGVYDFPIGNEAGKRMVSFDFNGYGGDGFSDMTCSYQSINGDTLDYLNASLMAFSAGMWNVTSNLDGSIGDFELELNYPLEVNKNLTYNILQKSLEQNKWTNVDALFPGAVIYTNDKSVSYEGVGKSGWFVIGQDELVNESDEELNLTNHSEVLNFKSNCTDNEITISYSTSIEQVGDWIVLNQWKEGKWHLLEQRQIEVQKESVSNFAYSIQTNGEMEVFQLLVISDSEEIIYNSQVSSDCSTMEDVIGDISIDNESGEVSFVLQSIENEVYELSIFDVTGKHVFWEKRMFQEDNDKRTINLGQTKGVYFIQLVNRNGEYAQKILIN